MSGTMLFLTSVLVYAGFPLLFALRRTRLQFLLLYTHIAAVLTLGGLLGAVYVLPVGHVSLLAGQVAYGGFMFSTLLTVVVGRDLAVVRNIVALTVAVDAVVYFVFTISHDALAHHAVPNPLGTDPALFDQSLRVVVLGGALIIAELLALLAVLEALKGRLGRLPMAAVYVVGFIGMLTLDGLLFPTLVLMPGSGLGALIKAGVEAKLVLAGSFAVPLLLFVALYRPALDRFEQTPLNLGQLLSLSRDPVLDQLQQTSAAASRASATVAQLLDSASSTVLIATDPDLAISHFNRGAQRLLGYSEEEVLGRSPLMFHSDEEIARHAAALGPAGDAQDWVRQYVADGVHRDWEYRTRDGESVMVSVSVTPIIDDEGRLVGYLGAGEDVTDRIRAAAALSDALRREEEAVARLEEADRVKDELVSTVSHELRTPITSIQGYTELLEDGSLGELTPAQGDALDKVLRNTARLEALVGDLLFVAQGDAGAAAERWQPVDLCAVVDASRESVAQLARDRELALEYDLDRPATVHGDAASLDRVVLNLIGNAVKFTLDGGRVQTAVGHDQDGVTLVVRDTGIGVPTEDLPRVFHRFFRSAEANRRAIPGTGLGLSVVHRIVTDHGGTISIDSAMDEGTTVTVRFPG